MGFLKFQETAKAGSGLHWSRAEADGAPFRGAQLPLLREEEYEQLAQRVYDTKTGIFDTSDPSYTQHERTYQEVMDGVMINWFKLLVPRKYRWAKRNGKVTMLVYVEWAEPYMQVPKGAVSQADTLVKQLKLES